MATAPPALSDHHHAQRVIVRGSLTMLKRAALAARSRGDNVFSPPPNLESFRGGRRVHAFAPRTLTGPGAPPPAATLADREVGKVALHIRIEAGTGTFEAERGHGLNGPPELRDAALAMRGALGVLLDHVHEANISPEGDDPDEDACIACLAAVLVDDYHEAYARAAEPPVAPTPPPPPPAAVAGRRGVRGRDARGGQRLGANRVERVRASCVRDLDGVVGAHLGGRGDGERRLLDRRAHLLDGVLVHVDSLAHFVRA